MQSELVSTKIREVLSGYLFFEEDVDNAIEIMEQLWKPFKPYADKNFSTALEKDFIARFWEMYLANTLFGQGYSLIPRDKLGQKGPDICIENEKIWIEAISAGKGGKDIESINPDNEVILRYRSLIKSKFEKYQIYQKDGIIKTSEPYIIAINAYRIPFSEESIPDYMKPNIVKAVFPLGDYTEIIDTDTGEIKKAGYSYCDKRYTQKNSPVATDLFIDDEYKGISGILFSTSSIKSVLDKKDNDFIFVHNPKAKNPVQHGWIKLGREYTFKANKLFRKVWQPA